MTATSSTIEVLIPPGIPMVIYGVVSGTSIARLFLGGMVPGILVGLALMGVTFMIARRRDYPVESKLPLRGAEGGTQKRPGVTNDHHHPRGNHFGSLHSDGGRRHRLTPILLPIVTALGIDPVHFGIIMIMNLAIGLFSPPVGVCLFVFCGIAGIGISESVKAFVPFFAAMVLVLLAVTYIPALATCFPSLLG